MERYSVREMFVTGLCEHHTAISTVSQCLDLINRFSMSPETSQPAFDALPVHVNAQMCGSTNAIRRRLLGASARIPSRVHTRGRIPLPSELGHCQFDVNMHVLYMLVYRSILRVVGTVIALLHGKWGDRHVTYESGCICLGCSHVARRGLISHVARDLFGIAEMHRSAAEMPQQRPTLLQANASLDSLESL